MNLIYNILIKIVYYFLKIIALFNKKINLFVKGREALFTKISSINPEDRTAWIHAASLGEFEQARPIIERIKKTYPDYKIILTFFSPSGYEIRKNYTLADVVCYLPFDKKQTVRKFIKTIHPNIGIIVKYEFWPNLLDELKYHKIKTILISGNFRKDQIFFKSYGKWFQKKLDAFDHFFVQNKKSKELLNSIDFNNVSICGDTRFDRVYEILHQNNTLNFVKEFKDDKTLMVAGSTWIHDEKYITEFINHQSNEKQKFIIAPHNINKKNIEYLVSKINKETVLYSEKYEKKLKDYQVLILDTIGILTKVYSYADIAYVGGGLSTGLHNILEPATFGIPIIFGGLKYDKFNEAKDLVNLSGCITIKNQKEVNYEFNKLLNNLNIRKKKGEINKKYVKEKIGASKIIIDHLKKIL